MRFTYTVHAEAMLVERGLDREWIERAVLHPDSTEPDPTHADRIRAFKSLPERDGRVVRVVYVDQGDAFHVITLFLDRRKRRG
jgi:hypothetical protein